MITVIQECRGCHGSELSELFRMDPMPLAGMFCRSAQEAVTAEAHPLTWVRCRRCDLVQVAEDVDAGTLFESYNYASSTVPGLVRHFDAYAGHLAALYGGDRAVTFLEIGCNDGVLLRRLPGTWRVLGVDPSDVAARAAAADRWQLYNAGFSVELVQHNGLTESVDVISGSNCLAHISDLKRVFEAAWLALRPGGEFWIEVHELAATVSGAQWDTIYHEHKAEWSECSLVRSLGLSGFEHVSTQRLPLHGGILRCRFRKDRPKIVAVQTEPGLDHGLATLSEAYRRRRENPVIQRLLRACSRGERLGAYGASGRANVFLNQIPELCFEFIVDEAPLRQGKWIPVRAVPVVSPDRLDGLGSGACLITAWNYAEDIRRKHPRAVCEWLTSFPWSPKGTEL